ncbi:MAG: carboxymuconolactone decarboxylase family protein [Acidimicrobiales bacterium]
MALSDAQSKLREQFLDDFGYWNREWEEVLTTDETFFASYLEFAAGPYRSGHLDPLVRELVHIAVDASATHLFEPGIRAHVRRALELGGTSHQIMEVLEMTATLGIHSCIIAVPILLEELGDRAPANDSLSEHQERIKADFVANRGYWNPFWDGMLVLDADFMDSYMRFSSVPWLTDVLQPKVRELVIIAFDVAATHLFVPGLHQHIRNALGYGAPSEEIMEVIEIASTLGIHSCNLGVPILLEELRRAGD